MAQNIQSTYQHALAIHIEGVGPLSNISSPVGKRLGYLWTTDTTYNGDTGSTVKFQPVDQSSAGAATVVDGDLLEDSLSGVGHSIDVFKSEITWGAFDFEVRGSQFNVELLRFSQRNPSFELTSSARKSDGALDTTATGGALAGQVGFLRDETVYFDTHNGGGNYTVTRGFYLSTPQYHGPSANIYTDVPFWKNRRVRFYTYAVTEPGDITLERRYVGLIDGSPQHDHSRIVVPTTSYGAQLRGAKCNRDSFSDRQLASDGAGISAKQLDQEGENKDAKYAPFGTFIFDNNGESKLIKQNEYSSADDLTTWLQFNDLIIPYNGGNVESLLRDISTIGFGGSEISGRPQLPFGQTLRQDAPSDIDNIFEPFVVAKKFDQTVAPNYGPFSATRFLDNNFPNYYKYHPISIVASLLMSSYADKLDVANFDVLHGNWGIGAYSILAESFPSDAKTIIDENPQDQVDYFILGQQGSDVDLWRQMTNLLRTWGYYWTVKKNGRLSINKIRNSDIKFWNSAQNNEIQPVESSTLMVSNGVEDVVDTVQANVGKIKNIQDSVPIQVQIKENNPNRNVELSRQPSRTIEMDSIFVDNLEKAQQNIKNLGFLQTFAQPKFKFRVQDYLDIDSSLSQDYSLGAPALLKRIPVVKKWISRQGNQQRIDDKDLNFASRIVSRTFLPKQRAYEMQVEIIGFAGLARWRSPSGIIESVDAGTNTITLEHVKDAAGEKLRGADPFHVGDEIQIYDEEGRRQFSTIQEITSIPNRDDIVLDGFAFSSNPKAGQIVELAYLDIDESGTGFVNKGILGNIGRPYAGLADTASTLGDPDSDADIYGAR